MKRSRSYEILPPYSKFNWSLYCSSDVGMYKYLFVTPEINDEYAIW